MDINTITIIGRLTEPPKLKQTNNGKSYCRFSIAVNGFKENDVSFFTCVAWNKTAELITKYLGKGDQCGIQGSLSQNRYQDQNGNKKSAVNIIVNTVQFLQKSKQKAPDINMNKPPTYEYPDDDNVPY